jgi:hypothetical protein
MRTDRTVVTVVALLPAAVYLALIPWGLSVTTVAELAPAVAAMASLAALAASGMAPRLGQRSAPATGGAPGRLGWRAVWLTVVVLLVESVINGLIDGFTPIGAADGPDGHAARVRALWTMVLGLPVALVVIFRLGGWSARLLPVRRPLVWLAAVALGGRLVRLASFPFNVRLAHAHDLAAPRIGETLVHLIVVGLLFFGALGLGNVRRRAIQSQATPSNGKPAPASEPRVP